MEPKRKVTDLKENEVIHCQTAMEALRICNLMQGNGWDKVCANPTAWYVNREETYYRPKAETYGNILQLGPITHTSIYPASDFLVPIETYEVKELKWEQPKEKEALTFPRLMLVRDNEGEEKQIKEVFACEPRLPNPFHSLYLGSDGSYGAQYWKFAEEIPEPTELTTEEAIARLNEGTKPEPGQTFIITPSETF